MAAFLTAGLVGCGELTREELLERAERSMEQGDYGSAVIDYRNALQSEEDVEVRGLLGLAMKGEGRTDGAIRHLGRALDEGADADRYALPLARLLVETRQGAAVLELPEPGLEGAERAEFLAYRAIGGFGAGGDAREQARADLDAARELAPEHAVVHLAGAYEALSRGDQPEASVAVDRAVRTDGDLALGWSLKGDLARLRDDLGDALAAYDRAVELQPQGINERLSRGSLRLEQGEIDGAEEDALFVREGASDHPGGYFLAGLVAVEREDRDEARRQFESALAQHDRYRPPMPYLAQIHLEAGNVRQAEHYLERFHALGPGNARSYTLLANLRVEQGDPERARDILAEVVKDRPDLRDALGPRLAALYLDTGERERGVEALRGIVDAGQDTAAIREMLGVALVQDGDREGGLAMLESAAEADHQARGADMAILVAYLQDQRFEDVHQAAKRLEEKAPDNPSAYAFQAAALMGQQDVQGAKQAIRTGLEQLPGHVGLSLNLSELSWLQGNADVALDVLETVQRHYPGEPTTAFRLVAANVQLGDEDKARDWLGIVLEHHPVEVGVLVTAAEAYANLGDLDRSTTLLERALDAGAESGQIYFLLARNYGSQGQSQAAIEALRSALAADSEHVGARLALTRELGAGGQMGEAREVLAPLLEAYGEEPGVKAHQAWLYLREGQFGRAADLYAEVLDREQRRSWVVEGYQAMIGAGREDAAFERLEAWLEEEPTDGGVRHELARALMERDLDAAAREVYQDHLDHHPEDVVALNNLAWLYRGEDPARALEYAERAHELASDHAEVLDTYGVVLLEAGHTERAVEILEGAWRRGSERPDIGVNLARALLAADDVGRARGLLDTLLSEYPSFDGRAEAEELLGRARRGQ
ncbi:MULTISPECIES: XrtA/PEP-CTERM system TPR-repeat protein PrsT [Halorhodospira]|uniref:XrtA/PEP-CTERM system TPR-repeat protein PrsT n=1 Tax=Halorhodospira TaxID=85108 RepID=UPI001EE91243|nr:MULTISPECIES: XrtA/PEP-CTERM system TPR-repeat protein PrsT [Halorhodospira]MCG5528035.1 PEP-CTERM system TPR-repeat protein PrsT [Halorhodospira halophila]MCG5542095.1 PEP-CTERM system TPR-repeat protein PrsT [Halorhodospira sp. 9628]